MSKLKHAKPIISKKKRASHNVLLIIALAFSLLILPCVAAVDLKSGTILNTTATNTSLTFNGVNITVDAFLVSTNAVTLYNTTYTLGELFINASTAMNWSGVNSVIDSGDMLNLSYSTNVEKRITNSLSNSFTTDIGFNVVTCDSLGTIKVNGDKFKKNNGYTCANNYVIVEDAELDVGENNIEIDYSCSSFTTTGFNLIMIMAGAALVIFVFVMVYRNGWEGVSLGTMVVIAIGILIGATMWLGAGQNLGGACPVG